MQFLVGAARVGGAGRMVGGTARVGGVFRSGAWQFFGKRFEKVDVGGYGVSNWCAIMWRREIS